MIRWVGFMTAAAVLSGIAPANALDLSKAEPLIHKYADDVCVAIPIEENGNTLTLKAEGKVELANLVKALVDAGAKGAVTYTHEDKRLAVLQKDLAQAIKDETACRTHVFDILIGRLLPPPNATLSGRTQAPPAVQVPPLSGQCVISGGNNFGMIIQTCAPQPQMIPLKPVAGEPLLPKQQPDGTYVWQAFVRIIGPTDVRGIACGDDITDFIIAPWPSGITSSSAFNGIPQNCKGEQVNQASSGTWVFQAKTKSASNNVAIKGAIGNFTQIP
jgi:hypothetical protein